MAYIVSSLLTQNKVNNIILYWYFLQIFSFDRQVGEATQGHVNLLETY